MQMYNVKLFRKVSFFSSKVAILVKLLNNGLEYIWAFSHKYHLELICTNTLSSVTADTLYQTKMKKQLEFVTVCVCVCYINKYGVEMYSQKQEASKNKCDLLIFSIKTRAATLNN